MDGGMSWRQKISKLHWIKLPQKNSPQRTKFGSEKKNQNLGVYLLISGFLIGKASKNWQQWSLILQYHFGQKTSLIWWTSTHSTLKKMFFCNTAKNPLTSQIFQQTCFWLVSEKKIALHFLDAQELHSRNTGKAHVCIFLNISVRSFYLMVGWITYWRRLLFAPRKMF